MTFLTPLLSSPLIAQTTRTYFEWARLRQFDQWWHWLLFLFLTFVLLSVTVFLYKIDTRSLPRGTRIVLALLRVFTLAGILCFFLDLQKRTEQKLVQNSRVVILVDTSQSMGISEAIPVTTGAAPGPAEPRIDQVISAFQDNDLIRTLQQNHDVLVYRFDEVSVPTEIASFPQVPPLDDNVILATDWRTMAAELRAFWSLAGILLGLSFLAFIVHFGFRRQTSSQETDSWSLLLAVLSLIVSLVFMGVASLRHPGAFPGLVISQDLSTAAENLEKQLATSSQNGTTNGVPVADKVPPVASPNEFAWQDELQLSGGATRLGDAIAWVVQHERGKPLAGIGIVTDGNSNRGLELRIAAQMAKDARVPLYPIGIGSELEPQSLRLVDLEAPARVFPGDEFKLTGFLQSNGMSHQRVRIQLFSHPNLPEETNVDDRPPTDEVLEEQVEIELTDGQVQTVPFRVIPNELGKRTYTMRLENSDDSKPGLSVASKVQVVDRKSRVLLFAGGPGREYQFLRNMLFRDRDTTVDVLVQTIQSGSGVSQEADKVLDDFPRTPGELFEYDCVVAFDPDWTALDRDQLELLEKWVGEKAGGLICVTGPVHTSTWSEKRRSSDELGIIRQLYPVTFHTTNATQLRLGQYGNTVAWPVTITQEGRMMPFFDLTEDQTEVSSEAVPWSEWRVFGYYPIRDVKPAAAVYAYHSDPQSAVDNRFPPFLVGQFYGAGRVIYMDTAEMWRLRKISENYFDRFYTKLIRYASQGRLLRDSNRGLLLVDKERAFRGDSINVRANVVDEQFQPLPTNRIEVSVRHPDKSIHSLPLIRTDGENEGTYVGQLAATRAGDYLLTLPIPSAAEPIVLQREVRVRLPNLETEKSQRNDVDLRFLADQTEGKYWTGIQSAMNSTSREQSMPASITSVRRETFVPGTPDRDFQQHLMSWLIAWICGGLSLEWLIRRLHKLA